MTGTSKKQKDCGKVLARYYRETYTTSNETISNKKKKNDINL